MFMLFWSRHLKSSRCYPEMFQLLHGHLSTLSFPPSSVSQSSLNLSDWNETRNILRALYFWNIIHIVWYVLGVVCACRTGSWELETVLIIFRNFWAFLETAWKLWRNVFFCKEYHHHVVVLCSPAPRTVCLSPPIAADLNSSSPTSSHLFQDYLGSFPHNGGAS